MQNNIENVSLNIPVTEAKWNKGGLFLPPNKEYTLVIDYPLETDYHKVFKTGRKGMKTLDLVKLISKAYEHVYKIDDAWEKKCNKYYNDCPNNPPLWNLGY